MAWIVNVSSDSKGNVHSVRLSLGASDKSDNSTQSLERLVNKLVLVEKDIENMCFKKCVVKNGFVSSIALQKASVVLQDVVVTS